MTARRPFRFGRGDDARVAEALAPFMAELRETVLVAPGEHVAAAHLEMMRLEAQLVEPTPGVAADRRVAARRARRSPGRGGVPVAVLSWPRRTACLVVAVCLAFAGAGLDAVGALPAPLQHISDTIKHHLGIAVQVPRAAAPEPGSSTHRLHHVVDRSAQPSPTPAGVSPGDTGAGGAAGNHADSGRGLSPVTTNPTGATPGTSAPTTPGSAPGATGPNPPPSTTPPTKTPPKKKMRSGGGPPPGLPDDWQARAVIAALQQLHTCAAATTLAPTGCPQHAVAPAGTTPQSVQWHRIGEPLDGAIAISEPAAHGGTDVSVYGRFQMVVSYTVAGAARPYQAFSGGLAQATMQWANGGYVLSAFTTIPAAQLPPGVTVAQYTRPAATGDATVLSAVAAGFRDCVTIASAAPSATVPDCPQSVPLAPVAGARWALAGDPTAGASVSFDPALGAFVVRGTFTMTLTQPAATAAGAATVTTVTGHYTASLVDDGAHLELIRIAGE